MRRGWFHLAGGAGLGRFFGFVSNLLLSRWLGPSELGLFNLLTTTVQTSDTLVRCGGDYALNFELGGQPQATQSERGVQLSRGLAQLCSLTTALVCLGIAIWVLCGEGLFPISLVAIQRIIFTGLLLFMVACEGCSASAWEVLLASHRTAPLALRQGLFFPLRIFTAAVGALYSGVFGAMCGWSLVAALQCVWLKTILRNLWTPLKIWPLDTSSIRQLLSRGLPFYFSNLLSSIIFYPLLLRVATGSGLAEIGYLRAGQILQQLFAFLPATLVPVLFLRLRGESSFADKALLIEKPLRILWLLLLVVLFVYSIVDQSLVDWLFGSSFSSSFLSTRILLLTALFEGLAQLIVQPLLASGKTQLYGVWQTGTALLAALLGWFWIPAAGLSAYLIIRLFYVIIPLTAFGLPVALHFGEPQKLLPLMLTSIIFIAFFSVEIFYGDVSKPLQYLLISSLVSMIVLLRHDLSLLVHTLKRS